MSFQLEDQEWDPSFSHLQIHSPFLVLLSHSEHLVEYSIPDKLRERVQERQEYQYLEGLQEEYCCDSPFCATVFSLDYDLDGRIEENRLVSDCTREMIWRCSERPIPWMRNRQSPERIQLMEYVIRFVSFSAKVKGSICEHGG